MRSTNPRLLTYLLTRGKKVNASPTTCHSLRHDIHRKLRTDEHPNSPISLKHHETRKRYRETGENYYAAQKGSCRRSCDSLRFYARQQELL